MPWTPHTLYTVLFVCLHVCSSVCVSTGDRQQIPHEAQTQFRFPVISTTSLFTSLKRACLSFFRHDVLSHTQVFLWVHIKMQFSASSACQFNGRAGSSHSLAPPPPSYPTPHTYTGLQPRWETLQSWLLCSNAMATTGHYKSVIFVFAYW